MTKIPAAEWVWNEDEHGYEGVHTREGKLVWFYHPYYQHGGAAAREQTFIDFLQNGPAVDGAPESVLAEIRALLSHQGKNAA